MKYTRSNSRERGILKGAKIFKRIDLGYWKENPEKIEAEIRRIFL